MTLQVIPQVVLLMTHQVADPLVLLIAMVMVTGMAIVMVMVIVSLLMFQLPVSMNRLSLVHICPKVPYMQYNTFRNQPLLSRWIRLIPGDV
jgi:hypothetical protein